MRTSSFNEIIESSLELGSIHVSGGTASSSALIIARHINHSPGPILVICENNEQMARWVRDLRVFEHRWIDSSIDVSPYPAWDHSPYSTISPSVRARFQRLRALHRIHVSEPGKSQIIVAPYAAALQSTIPPALFEKLSFDISHNAIESPQTILKKLGGAGYLRVDIVEDPGTFSMRGDLIDVYPSQHHHPIRIEFFGDDLERIRHFDPNSQRTIGNDLSEVAVTPAREVVFNDETIPVIRKNIKAQADEHGISRKLRDPIMESVSGRMYPEHSELWSAFAYEHAGTGTLVEHILSKDSNWKIAWDSRLLCEQNWDHYSEDQVGLFKEACQAGRVIPEMKAIYPNREKYLKHCTDRSLYFFDSIEYAKLDQVESEQSEGHSPDKKALSKNHRINIQTDKPSDNNWDSFFQNWLERNYKILIYCSTDGSRERAKQILTDRQIDLSNGQIEYLDGKISHGFRWPTEKLTVITDSDLLGVEKIRGAKKAPPQKQSSAIADWSGLQSISDLAEGDFVVHIEHGVGKYSGMKRLDMGAASSDFIVLEYAAKDKLYVPVYRLNTVQKHSTSHSGQKLDKLGSNQFETVKKKVKSAVKQLALNLVQLYAERSIRVTQPMETDTNWFKEFEDHFPFDETPDQLGAIHTSLDDLHSGRVMDRLICGDVGFGKTEVAMRAAFVAVENQKQVAVLVPTTILCFQHEESFKERFKGYPIEIRSLSRFKTKKEQTETLEGLKSGKIDIVIGTHRLLSKDVEVPRLGLLIIDEEHRFGVEHKEKLKALRVGTHVLTLTATPIPRTLHMSLSGIRDISLIATPPVDRMPIRTYVSRYDEALIKRAIEFELSRGGQVFFIHNRVQSIYQIAKKIDDLVPNAKVLVGHGQMNERELEKTMFKFYNKEANVLVCTTIVESGIDIPSANTMIIHRADNFGLAQLYQLRGRVGRSKNRAYCYLLVAEHGKMTGEARQRLEVIQRFVELGSGFNIASHDLEIRGGGNLLGPEQSGHIASVGFDLYTELLQEAIEEIRDDKESTSSTSNEKEPEIQSPFSAYLDEKYISNMRQRLMMYRRLSNAKNESELHELEEEIQDRFGKLPPEAINLLWVIRLKILLKQNGVEALTIGKKKVSITTYREGGVDPGRVISLISSDPKRYQLASENKFVVALDEEHSRELRDVFFYLEKLFEQLKPC